MTTKTILRLLACLTVAAIVTGCGSSTDLPKLVPVTGTVLKDGKGVEGVIVSFTPEKDGGISGGITNAEGVFELYYNEKTKGAVIGKHTVRLSKMEGEAGAETIPAEFNENSTIVKDVTEEGPNDFKFEI